MSFTEKYDKILQNCVLTDLILGGKAFSFLFQKSSLTPFLSNKQVQKNNFLNSPHIDSIRKRELHVELIGNHHRHHYSIVYWMLATWHLSCDYCHLLFWSVTFWSHLREHPWWCWMLSFSGLTVPMLYCWQLLLNYQHNHNRTRLERETKWNESVKNGSTSDIITNIGRSSWLEQISFRFERNCFFPSS